MINFYTYAQVAENWGDPMYIWLYWIVLMLAGIMSGNLAVLAYHINILWYILGVTIAMGAIIFTLSITAWLFVLVLWSIVIFHHYI